MLKRLSEETKQADFHARIAAAKSNLLADPNLSKATVEYRKDDRVYAGGGGKDFDRFYDFGCY